ncbi:uncharacterized protein SPPG_00687 [Spizellomyces punctatus DAOM BR117]|uniref:Cyclic nucleotide-binding domain-containing protein n=1 Tax=Spizellomyces punctatus (strain DAOM BR117) TaxID=645134 RepID=A0A0L0HUH7_SPIPD|nr:uncharacterized protein SPPG_00687 [Spizellomyces punctatus DAOM BR117]KND05006.1 hypothetical protein SPPG_00687 [Spizellomyces punctatus DAOM BR117]|eukprot:XP_016613045.1 hypothetical protein SPPG_00687 [Spizellomyces punctatus DAOM BR117]
MWVGGVIFEEEDIGRHSTTMHRSASAGRPEEESDASSERSSVIALSKTSPEEMRKPSSAKQEVKEPAKEQIVDSKVEKQERRWGLLPTSPIKLVWDLIMSCAYWHTLFIVPVAAGFERCSVHRVTTVSKLLTGLYTMDTLINAVTLRDSCPSLAKSFSAYVTSPACVVDVLTAIPYDLIYYERAPSIALGPLRLVRMGRAYRLRRILATNPVYTRISKTTARALKAGHIIVTMSTFAVALLWYLHMNACLTFLYGNLTGYWTFGEFKWVVGVGFWWQYAWGLLMAVANSWPFTWEVRPRAPAEIAFHIVWVLFGALITGCLTGIIQAVRVGLDPPGRLYNEKLDQVTEYMSSRNLDSGTRRRVREFLWLKFHGRVFDEGRILEEFNLALKQQIASGPNLLASVPVLHTMNEDFLGSLALCLQDRFYMPGEVIYKEGTIGSDMFWIASGSVEVVWGDGRKLVLTSGDFFGETALVVEIPRLNTVRAIGACHAYRLDRNNYDRVLQEFPDMAASAEEYARGLLVEGA